MTLLQKEEKKERETERQREVSNKIPHDRFPTRDFARMEAVSETARFNTSRRAVLT